MRTKGSIRLLIVYFGRVIYDSPVSISMVRQLLKVYETHRTEVVFMIRMMEPVIKA